RPDGGGKGRWVMRLEEFLRQARQTVLPIARRGAGRSAAAARRAVMMGARLAYSGTANAVTAVCRVPVGLVKVARRRPAKSIAALPPPAQQRARRSLRSVWP